MPRDFLAKFLAPAFFFALIAHAAADSVTFNVRLGEHLLTSRVELLIHGGSDYVPLKTLVEQFGGTCSTTPNQVQINLWGESARIDLDDTRVQSQAGAFALSRPARQLESGPAIARTDVAPLFKAAFGAAVTEGPPPASPMAQQPAAPAQRETSPAPIADSAARCIIIDAGHGGDDTGWVAPGPIAEKAISLAIATQVASLLQGRCETLLTRGGDTAIDIDNRISIANAKGGTVFVSIHAGAGVSESAGGFELFAPPPRTPDAAYPDAEISLDLAKRIEANVVRATGADKHGIRQAPCRIFRNLRMPGVLIEVGSMTNAADLQRIANPDYQARLARGIAGGLLEFMAAQSAR